MNHLSVENLSKSYNEKELFSGITFGINQGQKVALVGHNGCGKSTLLRIITGHETSDSGQVVFANDLRVAYLHQNPQFREGDTVKEAVFDRQNPLLALVSDYEYYLHKSETDPAAAEKLQELLPAMEEQNAWDYESQVTQILGKLGVYDLEQRVDKMSGGQKKRVAMAKTLIEKPDFLILDEPTNHLDLETIEWLEDYLAKAQLTLLMVTHDRYFLERVTNEIIEIDGGKLYKYKGNYSYFLEKKAEREQMQATEVDKARNLMKKELEWVRRQPKARGTKAKYRMDAFEDIKDKASQKLGRSQMELDVKTSRVGGKILEVKKISKSYGNKTLFKDFSYTFKKGDRIGVVGKNGMGKSTFLNILTGAIPPDSGEVDKGTTIVFGYYSQEEAVFNPEHRVIDVVKEVAEVVQTGSGKELTASQLLNYFQFPPAVQYTPVKKLSGGERRRLQLLRVLIKSPNFLILDEPTNDLDITTLNILEEYLESFGGSLIIVSHDRYFMDRLVDHLFVLEGNETIRDFPGNYTDYRETIAEEAAEEKEKEQAAQTKKEQPAPKPAPTKTEKRKLTFKEQKEFEQLEKEIASLDQKRKKLIEQLNSGSGNHEELTTLSKEIEEIGEQIDEKEMRWLELSEFVE
ncbi:ABC-F family ATP-binding cassette domain-containing protein [Nafulsella turpanensis]|uniref:ABC-F family ATP-binding cassette domain-containing protein n=1 Tax=Nafulsella turpanensis TaxID=1265690 RepID=UPI000347C33C|nr:ABC-F family ATP-binding cassette domain-containing protein [Nafulsella turpanensis]